jgi:IS30 family transposase
MLIQDQRDLVELLLRIAGQIGASGEALDPQSPWQCGTNENISLLLRG